MLQQTLGYEKAITFSVQAHNDAHVAFFEAEHAHTHTNAAQLYNVDSHVGDSGYEGTEVGYEIVIGGWGGTQSVIRNEGQGQNKVARQTRNLISDSEYRQFWASAANGLVRLGTGNVVGQSVLLFWQDPQPKNVALAAVATGWGSTGEWIVCIPEQCAGRYDATTATLVGAQVGSTSRQGHSGGGYVHFPDQSGDSIEFHLGGCEAGPFSVGMMYVTDPGRPTKHMQLIVNDVVQSTVAFPPSAETTSSCARTTGGTSCQGSPTTGWTGNCPSGAAADWKFAGCYVSDTDGNSHADPWSDGTQWKNLNWEGCRQAAIAEHSDMFVMEYGNGYEAAGFASCGHMESIQHGNYHDTGHNGNGRAPDSDCMTEVDSAGHGLGGPWRFAVYAPTEIADCLLTSAGPELVAGTKTIEECAAEGPQPPTLGVGSGGEEWTLVGCYIR